VRTSIAPGWSDLPGQTSLKVRPPHVQMIAVAWPDPQAVEECREPGIGAYGDLAVQPDPVAAAVGGLVADRDERLLGDAPP